MDNYDIKIELIIDVNNNLICNVQPPFDNCTYAFYLKKGIDRVAIRWYTPEAKVTFKINVSGYYSVICFIQGAGEKIIKESNAVYVKSSSNFNQKKIAEIIEKETKSISIFGSCVSRDVLEFEKIKRLELKSYIARQSIVSAVSAPVECKLEDIKIHSNFQKKQIYNDFVKNTFQQLSQDSSEFLLIDLIDERFSLVRYENSFVTNSKDLAASKYIRFPKKVYYRKRYGGYYISNISLGQYIDQFCEKILEVYDSNKIIIHKAFLLDFYIDKNGDIHKFSKMHLIKNKSINERLSWMYDQLIKNFPSAHVIDLCKDTVASENHKWGLAPMHYCDSYYIDVLEKIYRIILND